MCVTEVFAYFPELLWLVYMPFAFFGASTRASLIELDEKLSELNQRCSIT